MRVAALALATALVTLGAGVAEAQQSYRVNGPLRLTVSRMQGRRVADVMVSVTEGAGSG